jgi:hypothetical protein
VHQVRVSVSTAHQTKSATLWDLEILLLNAMKDITAQQKMASSQKISVMLDSDALLMNKQSSDACQVLTKVFKVKNHVKYVLLGIIAMKTMGNRSQLLKNVLKVTIAQIFLPNLLKIPISLQFLHLSLALLELTVMKQNSQVSFNANLAHLDIGAIEEVKRLMTTEH